MSPQTEPSCQALNLSDGLKCTESAVVWDDLFCKFHGKQCYGLYAGYKKRNAQLDALAEHAPQFLVSKGTPLANEDFEDVDDVTTLNQIHSHLFREYVLLGQVVDARKLHHKHFFPLQLDYGHQAYLDTLSNRRHIVLRALEKVTKRTVELLYAKEKWFEWIDEVQQTEEINREKESKKVKLEAAMFKRHWKKLQAHRRVQLEEEHKQKQNAFLEKAYQDRLSAASETDETMETWDPIEDLGEDEHRRYVDLIKHFLWMEILSEEEEKGPSADTTTTLATDVKNMSVFEPTPPTKSKKKTKSKRSQPSTKSSDKVESRRATDSQDQDERNGQARILAMMYSEKGSTDGDAEPDRRNLETEEEMRKRLKEGVEKNYVEVRGPILVGSLETPHGTHEKTAPMEDDEIESLMKDIKEIKLLLFCRLLLSHASLLPAALRAGSVDEFLDDTDISRADLRDLCLKVENPSLQDVRDACADLLRGDEEETEDEDGYEHEDLSFEDIMVHDKHYGHLQGPHWYYENMTIQRSKAVGEPVTDLREFLRPPVKSSKKTKVHVCGKSIWNYSNASSMSREGWLQFSILAKGCDLHHAVELCRNWDEFSQLNFLASWQYFPASNWVSWGTDRITKQLHDLGFFPFFTDYSAKNCSHHFQGGGPRSQARRTHHFVEARNIIVGHMKRNDSVTRRFLQYCSMRTGEVLLAVRDGRTDKIITAPRDRELLWTLRSKKGIGRAAKNEWEIDLEIGPDYFEIVDRCRNWYLGFDDYYEVWIWDLVPGLEGNVLYNTVVEGLRKAWRITKPIDIYNHQEPFLRSLTRNRETNRVRPIKSGEQVVSLWDDAHHQDNIFIATDAKSGRTWTIQGDGAQKLPPHTLYSEADAAEDAVLFPDELVSPNRNVPFKPIRNAITRLEDGFGTTSRYMAKIARDLSFITEKGRLPPGVPPMIRDSSFKDENEALPIDHETDELQGEDKEIAKHWRLPLIWQHQITALSQGHINSKRMEKLANVGLLTPSSGNIRQTPTDAEYAMNFRDMDRLMLMEKDRADALLEAFHEGDLEPGGPERYKETCEIIAGILGQQGNDQDDAWFWFALELLEWLGVRTDQSEYAQDGAAPWPHPFIAQDITKAWAYMAMFFPHLEQCQPATQFFKSSSGQQYNRSSLHEPRSRASTLPDARMKTSFRYRPKKFWEEWDNTLTAAQKNKKYYADAFPSEWGVTLRPILAKCESALATSALNLSRVDPLTSLVYLAGIVAPIHLQNSPLVCPGFAVANTEPHRPGKVDMFIDYADRLKASYYPPVPVTPNDFPLLLPAAEEFAAKHDTARFAILRLWSAPHFYPALIGDHNRRGTAFLDGAARSWRWNFIGKDIPISEWSMYNILKHRLDVLKEQLHGRVVHRDDVILVMGVDQLELLRYATAVTFAIQTKPWFRELDLWKSFVNVDLGFLETLDPYWLS
ncbi:hypothetical protein GGR57DRAFT_507291 [Xylariaceae sp. FL1272]|nr:hypothetical protein GGR57DRAFT_507291 [Xylariaceae sp. FL1272]